MRTKGGGEMPVRGNRKQADANALKRPDIYAHHAYREFLKEWFTYRKALDPAFSLRALAREAQLASGLLPMVMAGKRPLSAKALAKLAGPLGLGTTELSYLELLRKVEE